jgi:hypothetical protein
MQSCQVCGRSFDPLAFQVVVLELERGFDRVDCARSARTMASPGSRFAAAPLLALATPAAPVAFAARSHAPRLLGSTAATLGLLVAGTAAAALLWVRVVGTDTPGYTLGRFTAPPAFGHDRVQAQVEAAPASPGPANPTTVTVERVVTVPAPTGGLAGLAPSEPLPSSSTSSPPPTTSPLDRLSRPPTATSLPADETGRGQPTIGKGHLKHGELDGVHSPGHGKSPGNGWKPESKGSRAGGGKAHGQGHGDGHGKGKGKGHH